MKTYRIKSIVGDIISAEFPPSVALAVFPNYGEGYEAWSDNGTIVIVVQDDNVIPQDLGPLIKVEQIENRIVAIAQEAPAESNGVIGSAFNFIKSLF